MLNSNVSNYILNNIIGEGSFSKVYSAKKINTIIETEYAIKVIKIDQHTNKKSIKTMCATQKNLKVSQFEERQGNVLKTLFTIMRSANGETRAFYFDVIVYFDVIIVIKYQSSWHNFYFYMI